MITGEEPTHRTVVSAIFEARLQPIEASPIHCESQTRIGETGLGLDVQYASGKKSILRRQGAGKERNAASKAGFERLPENRKPLRQLHAVDPELHIGMLAAHMDLTKTVLCNSGHLQPRPGLKARFHPVGSSAALLIQNNKCWRRGLAESGVG